MTRRTAVVVAPGRGTYNKPELGYLARHHAGKADRLAVFDARRNAFGQTPLSELDGAARFSPQTHTRGDNASALIYASALFDFEAIDCETIDIVAVTGNSMGWYIALACAGAVSSEAGFEIVNTMGTLMQERLIGGQLIYPFVDEEWRPVPGRREELMALVYESDSRPDLTLGLSIDLGGMLVLAGDRAGLDAFKAVVPTVDGRFPMELPNHAAFHTPLQAPVAEAGRARLGVDLFSGPDLPLIDGRGAIWWPGATDPRALYDYTLGHQVTEPYNFTTAIRTAAFEFMPDLFIVLGPGTTLGGAVAQSFALNGWRGITDKATFKTVNELAPRLASMGLEAQRAGVVA